MTISSSAATSIAPTAAGNITIRRSGDRGHANHGWLDSYHSFSFSSYYDPNHMGFRTLRVINEDVIAPKQGFGTHGHRDMEIVTYVLSGLLEHRDSIGNGSLIRPGDVQRMSAGTGILHSEFNASDSEPLHLLQIWILPDRNNLQPGYEQVFFAPEDKQGRLRVVASPDGRDGSVTIHQDALIFASSLAAGDRVVHQFASPERGGWLQVARGAIALNGVTLEAGDAAAITALEQVEITASENAELLLFDLA
ncbi:pirin family protein [Limnothrix sp. FACHB-1083]|uniref:pirin family protein n=1 Tax=unclassified Limnothrix TaxID=2632864 RepID=UPI0016817E6A|nr:MULTISPECIES: pirin family protein [unclassified Limnothrix]MBD2159689.1 pirin family protein [Limnothrix sp. FACHB-1083]MBD2190391.1 pirin family protein [Limnothrix sp. FACHB-1088]